jgi:cytoskeletal protein CcmA (bactofilin family)
MFFKKKGGDDGTAKDQPTGLPPSPITTPATDDLPAKGASMTQQKPPAPAFTPEVAKRVVDLPGPTRRWDPAKKDGETKRLTVGRDIILSGEITSCDVLVVEGRVEATLSNSQTIEISSTGHFKGKAEIDEADINGVFDGTLTVRNRLMIRASGKVTGTVRYGQLEVERGGEVTGDVQLVSGGASSTS